MKQELTKMFEKQLEQAFISGVSSRESAELLLYIILWAYLSDSQESIDGKSQHQLEKSGSDLMEFDESAKLSFSKVEQVIRIWEAYDVNFPRLGFEVEKLFTDKLSFSFTHEVLGDLISFFKRKTWNWSREKTALLFESFEDVIAHKVHAAHFYHTPSDISELLVSMFPQDNGMSKVYDPFCRSGELLSCFIQYSNITPFVAGKTMDSFSWKLAATKMYMLGVPSNISKEDALFSEPSETYDIIVSNPPFGVQSLIQAKSHRGSWTDTFQTNRSEVEYLCHTLDHLAENGKAALIVPTGILFSGGVVEALRKQMISENILEAVVMLPPKVFLHTGVKTAVLFINKSKNSNQVLLVDATGLGVKTRARLYLSQADIQGIAHHLTAFRRKELKFTDERQPNCVVVTPQELDEHQYDLQYNSYRNINIESGNAFSSVELWEKCKEIEKQLEEVQKEINVFHRRHKIDVLTGKT